jgi:hypothetical protein
MVPILQLLNSFTRALKNSHLTCGDITSAKISQALWLVIFSG